MSLSPARRLPSPCIYASDLHSKNSFKRHMIGTFLFKPSDRLPFTRVLAILSSRFVLTLLVLARSGIVRSSTGRQLDKLHAAGVAQDALRFKKDGFESAALRAHHFLGDFVSA